MSWRQHIVQSGAERFRTVPNGSELIGKKNEWNKCPKLIPSLRTACNWGCPAGQRCSSQSARGPQPKHSKVIYSRGISLSRQHACMISSFKATCVHNNSRRHILQAFFHQRIPKLSDPDGPAVSKQIPVLQHAHWCDLLRRCFFSAISSAARTKPLTTHSRTAFLKTCGCFDGAKRLPITEQISGTGLRSAKNFGFDALPPRFWRQKGLAERCHLQQLKAEPQVLASRPFSRGRLLELCFIPSSY